MAKNTIILHLDWKVFLDVLPDAELGQWTRAIMHYMETGEPPEGMSKAVEVAFYASFERIGRDLLKYEKKCSNLKQYQSEKTPAHRKTPTRGVSDTESECDPDPVPEPDPEPDPVSSSSKKERSSASGATTMTTLIESYEGAYGTATPVIRRSLGSYVESLGPELVSKVIEVTAQAGGQKWPYLAKSLEECKRKGMDLAAYEAEQFRRKGGRNTRVDRPTPSGTDILERPASRPRRLKRED